MTPKFAIFDHIEDIPGTPTSRLFKDRLELIKTADQAGFAGYHFAEHHGGELCLAPSQELFIAAASQVTEQIRMGPLVKLLPMHHPVRVIEDLCVLDQLTEGRLDYGVGRGAVPIEHAWFGDDWHQSRDRFTDILRIVERALATGEISSEGSRFFDFPPMPMSTRPYQERIPFWYPGSPYTAGRHGMSLMWPGKIDAAAYEAYLAAWEDHKNDDIRLDGPEDRPRVGYSMVWRSPPPIRRHARSPSEAWRGSSAAPARAIASTTSSCPLRNAKPPRARCGRSSPTWTSPSSSGPAPPAASPSACRCSSRTGWPTTSASCSRPAT